MSSFGKKFLSAFVDITGDEKPVTAREDPPPAVIPVAVAKEANSSQAEKFRLHFNQLFKDANLAGPDYFEFSKMIEAMQVVTDEKARYLAAFAGLSVQGLDKQKLLDTAMEYIRLLDADASHFNTSVDAALKEKVQGKQQEINANGNRIEALNKEIGELENRIALLQQEVKENEAKIASNSGAYLLEMQQMKNKMLHDVEKIKQYL